MSLTQSNDDSAALYERKLMEKDKAFFDLSKMLKGVENENEAYENKLKSQECEVLNLKNEVSSLQSMLKIKDSQLDAKEEKLKKQSQLFKAKENELLTQLQLKEKKMNELSNAFNSQVKDYDGIIAETKKIEEQNGKISADSMNKDNMIKSLQGIISELKRDNKQIYTLNKVLSEKEERLSCLLQKNEQLISQNSDYQNENNQLKVRLNNLTASSPGGRGFYSNYMPRPGQSAILTEKTLIDLQVNFKNQLEQKDKYFNELNANYKEALKENEKLIQFTISQIKQIEKSLDITITYNLSTTSQNESSTERGHPIQFNSTHSLKYDLIAKNFDLISRKIFEKLSSNYSLLDQCQGEMSEIEERAKDLQFSNDKLKQDKASLETQLSKATDELREKRRTFEEMDMKYSELFNRCSGIEQILSDSNEKYAAFELETNDFLNRCLSIVQDFLSNDSTGADFQFNDSVKVKEEKVLESFNMIIKALIKQNHKEIELMKEAEMSKDKIEKLTNDFDALNQQYEDMIKETRSASIAKEEESKRQKGALVAKMNEMSALLEESNTMISHLEEENSFLKAKSSKLEHNIQMLTCSHSEIEKIIQSNTLYSNEVIAQKEHKINTLLREAELKDIQIQSLEKLLNELKTPMRSEENLFQMKQMKGKLLSKNQYKSLLMKKNNDDRIPFIPNEKSEKELKTLFQRIPLESNNDHSCININHPKGLNESVHSNNNCEEEQGNASFNTAPLNQGGYNQKAYIKNRGTNS